MSDKLSDEQIEAAKAAGFYWHPIQKCLVAKHSSGAWVILDEKLARFAALLAASPAPAIPACVGCEGNPAAGNDPCAVCGKSSAAPIPMLLFCPRCGTQHIDAEEWADDPHDIEQGRMRVWSNPPHRSHLCHKCGCIWRPADVATVGVEAIETSGKADTWNGAPAISESEDACLPAMPENVLADLQAALTHLEMWAKGEARYAPANAYDDPGTRRATIKDVTKAAKYLAPRLKEANFALQDYFAAIDAARKGEKS
ncbi:hypothetical protein [Burkholderia gladioli]|uniref:hypothetical protein n=1 Tax=Burkholderia gladioli TaxID=28095 RepID=UPI001641E80D|nr:hypothetical protein [Burkholderia gladioli]